MGKPIDERIKDELRQKLMNLFNASKPDTQGNTPPTKYLRVGTGAAKILNEFDQEMRSEVNLNGNGARIRDWCVRASQQALRIAGIFHLCGNDVPSEGLISEREMYMATRFMRVAYNHVKTSVLSTRIGRRSCASSKLRSGVVPLTEPLRLRIRKSRMPCVVNSELKRSISPSAGWSIMGRWRCYPRRGSTALEDLWGHGT